MRKPLSEYRDLFNKVAALFEDQDADVVGATLGYLLAIYFCGHHPRVRKLVMRNFMSATKAMIEKIEEEDPDVWPDPDPRGPLQ